MKLNEHSPADRLCERITAGRLWKFLEQVAIQAVMAGGMAAMGFYREALPWPTDLVKEGKNPSTVADLQATARILETVNASLPSIVRPQKLNCKLSYLAEETKYQDWFKENVTDDIPDRVLPAKKFFRHQRDVLRVLVDGIDGTGSFARGLPLFCSALAILVDDQPRVSAIYDPIHHVVYSALLPGPYEEPEDRAEAWVWQIAVGSRINLVELAEKEERKELKQEAIGIHLTRTDPQKLCAFLGTHPQSTHSMLERLARASEGIYALNSGIVALAGVATGALGGFVNIVTNLWDVAAGEVLVRACGGQVTDFDGAPIKYSSEKQVSLVAAKKHLHLEILDLLKQG